MCAAPLAINQDVDKTQVKHLTRALIIDDSKLDQMILKRMLLNNDYDICLASDGGMAIDMYEQYQPDIVLMDLHLPDISGYDLTKILKRLSQDKYVPVIFVTGTTEDEALGKCLESGGDDFIVKPIKEKLLKAKTNSLLRIKKMHDELLSEKEAISIYSDEQLKDLHDADEVIYNIHKPRFYNPGNLDWSYVAQNVLSGDIVCSAIDPSGNHIMLVGDNTGHGLPAAIGSMITCETFYSMVDKGFDIQLIIESINKKLYYLLPTDRFLSACILEIENEHRVMKVWNAGLPAVIACDCNGNVKDILPSMHMPLGIVLVNESDIAPVRINIEQDDRIYSYTDGLTEKFNQSGEMFGEQRLIECIKNNSTQENRVDAIINDTKLYSGNSPLTDDVLLLEVQCDRTLFNENKIHKISSTEIVPMNWHINFDLHNDVICKSNPIPVVIQTMVDIQGFGGHREKIFLILTEMYSNAVEHGLLDLDSIIKEENNGFLKYYELRQSRLDEMTSGNIKIDVEHYVDEEKKGVISLTMENNGTGFDYKRVISELGEHAGRSGRGIALISDLCRKYEYSNGGCKLNIEYEWDFYNDNNMSPNIQ
jgi:two-component system, HptB-dependent secretion and biofilm response regulator